MTRKTFAWVLDQIERDQDLPATRRRDYASAVRTFARVVDIDLERSVASIVLYRPRFQNFSPASANMTPKRWSNVLSDLRSVLAHLGVIDRRPSVNDLSPAWQELRERAKASDIRFVRGLSALFHFCNSRAIDFDHGRTSS